MLRIGQMFFARVAADIDGQALGETVGGTRGVAYHNRAPSRPFSTSLNGINKATEDLVKKLSRASLRP